MISQLSDQQIYIVHVTVLYEPDVYKWYYVIDTCHMYSFNTVSLYCMMFFLSFIQVSDTMLHYAACCGQNNVISYLLDIGADPNIQDVVSIYR